VWGNGARFDRPRRDRLGGEVLFVRGALKLKGEFMTGKDGDITRQGYYAHLGYRLASKIEGIFRFDSWDPNTRLETNALNVTERDYVAGFNYFIKENQIKFQLNYLRKTFTHHILPSRNVLVLNLQTSW